MTDLFSFASVPAPALAAAPLYSARVLAEAALIDAVLARRAALAGSSPAALRESAAALRAARAAVLAAGGDPDSVAALAAASAESLS